MEYEDKVYGQVKINDPVILDLINSQEIQRLKEIDQAGYYEPYCPGTKHTRFEHSMGVYLLLQKFGAPIEEQVAGLLHDVSHSVFSHAIDYVFADGSGKKQNHQDKYFKEYVLNSSLPAILKTHSFDVDYILEESNFPLKETELPDLCADRIDYSLRDSAAYKTASPDERKSILENLTIHDKKWVFKNFNAAYSYAKLFKKLNGDYYADISTAVMYRRVADYLRYAMEKQYISKSDLYTTEREVIDKINKNLGEDGKLDLFWKRMNSSSGFENNPDDYNVEIHCKSRFVDPLCWHEGVIKRVSEIKPDWKDLVKQESVPKTYFVKFSDNFLR